MSVNYASGLSDYPWKGDCGQPEFFDNEEELEEKITCLAQIIRNSKHMVVHTGAGISTSAGIPDFRGPKGVWTLELKGKAPDVNINFDDAVPTKTHMAVLSLQQHDIVKYVISQNIDGLHLRSGYPRDQLSELHGNMFTEKCDKCGHEYFRRFPVKTMALKRTGNVCTQTGKRGLTNCRGKLRDTILDWEDSLPTNDLMRAEEECRKSDLSLALGTSLQILPSGKLPLLSLRKKSGQFVVVNLQKTKYDHKATLVIHGYVDDVMQRVMEKLGLDIPNFVPDFYLSQVSEMSDEVKDIKTEEENVSVQVDKLDREIRRKDSVRNISVVKKEEKEDTRMENKDVEVHSTLPNTFSSESSEGFNCRKRNTEDDEKKQMNLKKVKADDGD